MQILGIVGSYRKGGVIDTLVSEVLAGAREEGATTVKIYLAEKQIEFCTNCRHCTQQPGPEPGICIHRDDMEDILALWKDSEGLVIGAPVNFFNVTALTRRFMERLVCQAYWPWGAKAPVMRTRIRNKKAVLITSAAMPGFLGRIFTGAPRALKATAHTMGANPLICIFAGQAVRDKEPNLPTKVIGKARQAGRKLARVPAGWQ